MAASGGLTDRLNTALYEQTLDCVHCGLCLTSCPTYRVTGRETASPRGRIYLMRGLAEGRLEDPELLREEAFLCLGCRACETACPSGVAYGEMLEKTRSIVRSVPARAQRGRPLAERIERFALREIVPHPRRLRWLVGSLAGIQKLRLDRLAMRILPSRLADMLRLLPAISPLAERQRMPAFTAAVGTRRGRVALFEGCMMPEFFGRVNEAARRVLSRAGYDVIVPPGQGCCGALQAHSGDLDSAHGLARRNASAFDAELAGVDAIIVTSAGCSAALREGEHWLGEAGSGVAVAVRDVLEFLDEVAAELPFPASASAGNDGGVRVCYDDPCHLIHAQGIADAPRRLLAQIPGIELVAHRNPEACCGAAGIYNLTQPQMSQQVLSPKLDALAEVAPEIVATANPGCAMQLAAGLAGRGLAMRVVHPVELLEEASRRTA